MTVSALMIGYGAIAAYVADKVAGDPEVSIGWVLARPGREEAARAALGDGPTIVTELDAINAEPDVALECAGHQAVAMHAPAVLACGIRLGIVSIGALADDTVCRDLHDAAARGGAALDLLSGAIGAIDALAAAREGGLDAVRYQSRKPPAGWAGTLAEEHCDLSQLTQPQAFFEGTARRAATDYPKNANVAATVALAGLGMDETRVELIADPGVARNTHRVVAEGAFGRFDMTIEGKPLPNNPKSSALTAMSAVRFLRNCARPVRI